MSATKRRKIEADVEKFQLSDNLCRFLPPTAEFTIGVPTEWFKTPRNKSAERKEDTEQRTPRAEPKGK